MKNYTLYGIGAALVDTEIVASEQDLEILNIEKGLMTLVDEERQADIIKHFSSATLGFKKASGGSAANSIIAASYFGSDCYFTGKLADDEDGHFYLNDMTAAGVDSIQRSQLSDGITGKCLVLITPDAERSMNTFLGASESLSSELINQEALKNSNYAYIEGYLVTSETGKLAAQKLRDLAIDNKVKLAVSLSDPGIVEFFHDDLKEMFGAHIDLLFCNKDEALKWCKTSDLNAAELLLQKQSKHYVITLGADGAIIWDGQERIEVAGEQVKAIDTNGAGDMFAGAYLHAINHDFTAQQSGAFACKAAAQVVQQYGPRLAAEDHAALKKSFFNT